MSIYIIHDCPQRDRKSRRGSKVTKSIQFCFTVRTKLFSLSKHATQPHAMAPWSHQRRFRRHLKDVPNTVPRFRRALQIRMRADPLRHDQTLFRCDGFQVALGQLFVCGRVVAEIFLVSDQDDRYVRTEVVDLRGPLLDDVLKTVRVVDGEAHDDHVDVRV